MFVQKKEPPELPAITKESRPKAALGKFNREASNRVDEATRDSERSEWGKAAPIRLIFG